MWILIGCYLIVIESDWVEGEQELVQDRILQNEIVSGAWQLIVLGFILDEETLEIPCCLAVELYEVVWVVTVFFQNIYVRLGYS